VALTGGQFTSRLGARRDAWRGARGALRVHRGAGIDKEKRARGRAIVGPRWLVMIAVAVRLRRLRGAVCRIVLTSPSFMSAACVHLSKHGQQPNSFRALVRRIENNVDILNIPSDGLDD
jgi:hypothetical protein